MIDGKKLRNNLIRYDSIRKIATGKGDNQTTGCLLDYNYFNNFYKMIVIYLSKQPILDADPKKNTPNSFYWISKSTSSCNNVFHY